MRYMIVSLLLVGALFANCKSSKSGKSGMSKTEKGAVIGASTGAVVGGIVGNRSKNTALGAIFGAAVGGSVGAVIGNKMDRQAKKMQDELGSAVTVERVGEGIRLTFNSQLLFDFGQATIMKTNDNDLRQFAETLKQYPETNVLIVGHTDNVGSNSYNQGLSKKRAAAVSNRLASLGVGAGRLRTQGKGESQPVVSNDSDSGRAQNRRVEIAIYANETMKSEAKKEAGK